MTTIATDEREILVDGEADRIFQLKEVKKVVAGNFQLKAKANSLIRIESYKRHVLR